MPTRLTEFALDLIAKAADFSEMIKKAEYHGHSLEVDRALTLLSELAALSTEAQAYLWLEEEDELS